jgi:hypothetical protein
MKKEWEVMETGRDYPWYSMEWRAWPVAWSAVWVGALAALAVGLVIGLVGFAIGAHESSRLMKWSNVKLLTLVFNVAGAFFAFVVGGWATARIAGIRRAEPAILHGSIVWALTVPMLVMLSVFGAHFGGWYGGLAGTPAWATAIPPVNPDLAEAMRNTALAALAALLIGLVGAVIGSWMASGEPMTFTHYRRRDLDVEGRPRRVA